VLTCDQAEVGALVALAVGVNLHARIGIKVDKRSEAHTSVAIPQSIKFHASRQAIVHSTWSFSIPS
jgi:hypothetical protein